MDIGGESGWGEVGEWHSVSGRVDPKGSRHKRFKIYHFNKIVLFE